MTTTLSTTQLLGNRYRVLYSLASGGFGDTYLAIDEHSPTQRYCVVKRLRPIHGNASVYPLVRSRFEREAAILEQLGQQTSDIPTLYAYFEEGGLFYLVQEWIAGQTLLERVKSTGPQSETTVREIVQKILTTLDFVHQHGIVHRDIKPDNIMLRHNDLTPVLIDFGAIKEAVSNDTVPSSRSAYTIAVGTPGFMSSEQSIGRPLFASDLYSLGLTAIFLLTAKLPHELTTDPMTGQLNWRDSAPLVSAAFAQVLDRAIQLDVRDRYVTAAEMLTALNRADLQLTHSLIAPTVAMNSQQVRDRKRGAQKPEQRVMLSQFFISIFASISIFILGTLGLNLSQFSPFLSFLTPSNQSPIYVSQVHVEPSPLARAIGARSRDSNVNVFAIPQDYGAFDALNNEAVQVIFLLKKDLNS